MLSSRASDQNKWEDSFKVITFKYLFIYLFIYLFKDLYKAVPVQKQ